MKILLLIFIIVTQLLPSTESKNIITIEKKVNKPTQIEKIEDNERIGQIKIAKININRPLYKKESLHNHVDKNITFLKESDFPDQKNGNVILAAHSGNSDIAYFNELYQLEKEDEIELTFKEINYKYYVTNKYEQDKNGTIHIYRNYKKDSMTLITCKNNDDNKQIVIILEKR